MYSVADLIVRSLREAGVATLFGVPGGGSNLDLIEAAAHAGVPFVLTATETAAALAAIAQAELTDRPGACLTALGPGAASVVDGVACAWLDHAPLLVFTDAHPSSSDGMFEHQRIDHAALLAPIVKWSATIDAGHADETMRRAIACATSCPPGPVHIDCPADVTALQAASDVARPFPPSRTASADGGLLKPPGKADRAASQIVRASKPLVIAGLGARRPEDAAAIRAFCRSHHAPAMVTYTAKGVVPDDDAHFAGVFTSGVLERPLVEQADLLIAVGLDPVELLPRSWMYAQPILACGRWRVDDRHVPFVAQLVGDIATGLRDLDAQLPRSDWDLEALRQTVGEQRERLHIIVIVFSDGALSLIDVEQRQRGLRSDGVMLGDVAWAPIAESFRMAAHAATTKRELQDAIERGLARRGPTLIDARIDPAGYDETLRAVRG